MALQSISNDEELNLPGVKHKVIGLVSGGKDSCFNLMHCIANGHEIVALATLTPEPGVDELDSHLYQSVGTHLLPLLAKSMGLPLFTRVIKGKAVAKGPEYGSRLRSGEGSGEEGDETEDLMGLLRDVLSSHPEATALASGAILSTYQRLRIEHVCTRLNLTSLSYLWQSAQLPLLDRMLSSGVEAVLMKVAGVGLGVEVVGKSLGEIMGLLRRLERTYGSHPAGEGGEYETLTLSTPLFAHRLRLTKTNTIITDPEPYPVAYLKVEEAELEPKEGWVNPSVRVLREMLGLPVGDEQRGKEGLDEEGIDALGDLGKVDIVNDEGGESLERLALDDDSAGETTQSVRFGRNGRWFAASVEGQTVQGEDVGQELKRCFDAISATLSQQHLSLPLHATHITLLLSSMSLFLPANEVYKTYFGTSPPSRATVAVPLERGRVRVEVVGFDDRTLSGEGSGSGQSVGGRSGLHVQGLSYWAPANIGPYSQAVVVNSRLHLAGQIPLIPASLTLPLPSAPPTSPYPHQATLALQHVRKIVDVLRSKNSTGGGWEGWVESAVGWWATPPEVSGGGEAVGVVRKAWDIWTDSNGGAKAPIIFVQAKELPKGALVEYQVNLHTGRSVVVENQGEDLKRGPSLKQDDDDDDDDDDELEAVYGSGKEEGVWWESVRTSGRREQGSRAAVFVRDLDSLTNHSTSTALSSLTSRSVTIRIYHLPLTKAEQTKLSSWLEHTLQSGCWTFVPVLSIHDRSGKAARIALEIFGI
ncbi:hypothetical protein CI109_106226 [Kwoniella shandongensis]|uniref:Diphthine--ammonia ligase n=1 Tax=Kwoniella shandongensis TaxID=1734106 RepID=A0A5M6BYC8_9TREE|nr:uncharacterized protein CI109_003830 [Kwoniella shandongensis]KAA5527858.1 hypothetical protein CI109_003830 [Kwoniella shandongensis]